MLYRISHYLTNDKRQWTSIYDIDNPNYDLTLETYLHWEKIHIDCIMDFVNMLSDENFIVNKFEAIEPLDKNNDRNKKQPYKMIIDDYCSPIYQSLYLGQSQYEKKDIIPLIKILLREEAWFVIESENMSIDVGFDYYIHIETSQEITDEFKNSYLLKGILIENWVN